MIAFYAPLKAPDHPVASGDRRMARLLFAALESAGFAPRLESRLRAYEPTGEPGARAAVDAAAHAEAARLLDGYRAGAQTPPRLWFTYHCYYKAVDGLGPAVARALGIPYCVAEASRAPSRARGPFAAAHALNETALDAADAIFVMTAKDRPALQCGRPAHQRLIDLPPFVEAADAPFCPRPRREEIHLLAVAMMRRGDKLASYRQLARALALVERPWRLAIAGDGPARAEVEGLFAAFGGRVRFAGLVADPQALGALYEAADLLVWPAVNEAYGMAFLEAAAHGCPALAGSYGGVASVVIDGETGVLVPPGDVDAFARALERLAGDPAARRTLGERAHALVRGGRNLAGAARILRDALTPLIGRGLAISGGPAIGGGPA
ncbi:glycosyltransferase family 4 protein [Pseudochelatococcus sp. B33]